MDSRILFCARTCQRLWGHGADGCARDCASQVLVETKGVHMGSIYLNASIEHALVGLVCWFCSLVIADAHNLGTCLGAVLHSCAVMARGHGGCPQQDTSNCGLAHLNKIPPMVA